MCYLCVLEGNIAFYGGALKLNLINDDFLHLNNWLLSILFYKASHQEMDRCWFLEIISALFFI